MAKYRSIFARFSPAWHFLGDGGKTPKKERKEDIVGPTPSPPVDWRPVYSGQSLTPASFRKISSHVGFEGNSLRYKRTSVQSVVDFNVDDQ